MLENHVFGPTEFQREIAPRLNAMTPAQRAAAREKALLQLESWQCIADVKEQMFNENQQREADEKARQKKVAAAAFRSLYAGANLATAADSIRWFIKSGIDLVGFKKPEDGESFLPVNHSGRGGLHISHDGPLPGNDAGAMIAFCKAENSTFGLHVGASRRIVISSADEIAYAKFSAAYDIPPALTWQTGREVHRLFKSDDRLKANSQIMPGLSLDVDAVLMLPYSATSSRGNAVWIVDPHALAQTWNDDGEMPSLSLPESLVSDLQSLGNASADVRRTFFAAKGAA